MVIRHRRAVLVLLAPAVVLLAPRWLPYTCGLQRVVLSAQQRREIDLQNRTERPQASDFDSRVTLATLLERGDDRTRWSDTRAAAVEGYVVGAREGAIEVANCLSFTNRDTHVELARRRDAPQTEQLIVEVTPPMRAWAAAQGLDWSTSALQPLVGKRVRIEGWLMYDTGHDEQSENTAPGRPGNWRATAWELHPVTSIRVLE